MLELNFQWKHISQTLVGMEVEKYDLHHRDLHSSICMIFEAK